MRILQYIIASTLLGPAISVAITITTPETCSAPDTTALRDCLVKASTNSYVESFTIQLQAGTYSTQDDGSGTFIYTTPNKTHLIIQGANTQDGWWDVPRQVPKWKTQTILSGADADRIFELNATDTIGGSVTFKNITLQHGSHNQYGAAVANLSSGSLELHLLQSIVQDNNSVQNNSLYNTNSVTSSSFLNNQGSVANVSGKVTSSYFENNISTYNAGAIQGSYTTRIEKSIFKNNRSENANGGAVADVNSVTNSLFVGNSALKGQGGAIFRVDEIADSEFIDNTATEGGALYLGQTSSFSANVINNTVFTNNNATSDGGAIYSTRNISTIINNSQFISNVSQACGGAFKLGEFVSTANLYKQNTAKKGGAICIVEHSSLFQNRFINNEAITSDNLQNDGRDIYIAGDKIVNDILINLLNNSFFTEEGSNTPIGSSIWSDGKAILRFHNNLVVTPESMAIAITSSSTEDVFYNNIFLSQTPIYGAKGGYLRYNYVDSSKVSGLNQEHNVFNLDALGFVDADAGDYHLTETSPLRNIGFAFKENCVECKYTYNATWKHIAEMVDDQEIELYAYPHATTTLDFYDLDNNPRETDGLMDLGPYEYQPLPDTPQILSFSKTSGDYRIGQTVTFAAHVSSPNSTLTSVQVMDEDSGDMLCDYQGEQLNTVEVDAEFACKLTAYGNRTLLLQVMDAAGKQGSFGLNVQIADYTDYEKGVMAGVAQVQKDPAAYNFVTTNELENQKQASQLLGEQQGIQYVLNHLNEYNLCNKDICQAGSSSTFMDFDGDKVADILWRNQKTGVVYAYYMNANKTIRRQVALSTVSLSWQIVGAGDFDGDGDTDILWRNQTTGINYLYLMQGEFFSGRYLNTVADQNWKVAAVADYNKDGQADILWRNQQSGSNAIQYLTNSLKVDVKLLNTIPTDWQVEPFLN